MTELDTVKVRQCAEHLNMLARDLRADGFDLPQVQLRDDGVSRCMPVVDELELIASNLRIAIGDPL